MKKSFDPKTFRAEFPGVENGAIYLDSAATALKPFALIQATNNYYINFSAPNFFLNIDSLCETARKNISDFIHSNSPKNIIWTNNATDSINLIAQSFLPFYLQKNDEIIVSEWEHHSNLLPWIKTAKEIGAKIIVWKMNKNYQLQFNDFKSLFSKKTRFVAITQMSNVTGNSLNLKQLTDFTHKNNALIFVDGTQGIVHQPTNVQKTKVDFYVFSAHKLYGPTGIGLLYVKNSLHKYFVPQKIGGKIVKTANFENFELNEFPYCFEAGTKNIVGILGFNSVINWLKSIDFSLAENYCLMLANIAKNELSKDKNIVFLSTENSSLLTFYHKNIHYSDLFEYLQNKHIYLREGRMCAYPLFSSISSDGALRVSIAPYNNKNEILKFTNAINEAIQLFSL